MVRAKRFGDATQVIPLETSEPGVRACGDSRSFGVVDASKRGRDLMLEAADVGAAEVFLDRRLEGVVVDSFEVGLAALDRLLFFFHLGPAMSAYI
ncbi:hypothetical protein MTO96_024356 [Rhipicephalus appendiculatus]